VLLEVIHQLVEDGCREGLIGRLRPVTRVAEDADFIFHLHQDHAVRRSTSRIWRIMAQMLGRLLPSVRADAKGPRASSSRRFWRPGFGRRGKVSWSAFTQGKARSRRRVFPTPGTQYQADALIDQPRVLDGRIQDLEVILALLGSIQFHPRQSPRVLVASRPSRPAARNPQCAHCRAQTGPGMPSSAAVPARPPDKGLAGHSTG